MNLMRYVVLLTGIFLVLTTHAQKRTPLQKALWQSVSDCAREFGIVDGVPDDGDPEIIDDTGNGYIKISGEAPPCGCPCENVSGAYRQKDGTYTLLTSKESPCNWSRSLLSNRMLEDVLPVDFGIRSFIPDYAPTDYHGAYAVFYLDVEIPRKGTDTKVTLRLIQNNVNATAADIIAHSYTLNANSTTSPTYKILFNNNTSTRFLENLRKGAFYNFTKKEMEFIQNELDTNDSLDEDLTPDKYLELLQKKVIDLHEIYQLYLSIKYKELLLGWDRSTSRFYIKDKIPFKVPKLNFKEFLEKEISFYWVAC